MRSAALNQFGLNRPGHYWPRSGGGPERNHFAFRIEICAEIQDFQAVPGGAAGHRDLVTRLEFLAVPAISDKVIRRRHFDGPFHDAAIFVLHFESDQRVRLDKMELLNGSL